ncbi:MAG: TonB-dependent receptor [Acidobacteria bacterium]|nr:TonB-dependent receptor [Acidobacteriota bacterium]MDA1234269.1 TonB-dependent receptor [Acidobacteriota bacterium]
MQGIRIIALFAVGPLSLGADCIQIRVVDPQGLPVTAATASIGQSTAKANAAGIAELCEEGALSGPVRVQAQGFATAVEHLAVGESPQVVELRIRLHVETPVVVTGTVRPTELADLDRSLRVISASETVAPAWSFAELLKQDSSIHMRERGPDGTQADLSIRGSTFDQVLVMINGVRVSDSQTGHHTLDLPLPFEAVQQVEVLAGAGATLYGSDAVGGTVNFVTKKPESKELRLMSGIGEHGWNRLAAFGGFRRGIWSQSLAGSRDFSTGFAEGRNFRNVSLSSESFFDTSVGTTSVLVAYNDRPFGANGFYGPWNSWEDTGTKFLSATQTIGRNVDRLNHRFNFAFRRHNDNFILCKQGCVFGGVHFRPEDNQNLHQTNVFQGSYTVAGVAGTKVRWSGGAQVVSDGIDSTVAGQRRRERASIFAMLDLRPTERLTLSAGVREEAWDKWRVRTNPTFSAGYWIGGGLKIRALASSAFRIPTYTDLYHRDPGNVGNSSLVPEAVWNYEAGADWFLPFGTKVSAAWFQRRENNSIDWVKDEGSAVFQARNTQKINFTGAEFEVRHTFRNAMQVWGNYTALQASQSLPVGGVSRYVFNFPSNQGNVGLQGAAGPLLFKTRLGAYNRASQTARALWDVSIGRSGGSWRPFIQATNVLDAQHEAFQGLAQPGRWIRGGVQIDVFRPN